MTIEDIKTAILGVLKKYNVRKAALFGSAARGEATDKSDIDVLVEFEGKKTLFDLAGLQSDLEDTLKKKVDVLTYKSLHPLLRDKILREQKPIL